MAILLRKLFLLVWKNFILQFRRPIGTCVEILLPVGFLALLIIARDKIDKEEKCLSSFYKEEILNQSRNLYDYRAKLLREAKIRVNGTQLRLAYYPINDKTRQLMNSSVYQQMGIKVVEKSVSGAQFTKLSEVVKDAGEYDDQYIGLIQFNNAEDNGRWDAKVNYSIRMHHTTGKLYNQYGRSSWFTQRAYPDYVPTGAGRRHMYKSPFLSLQYAVDSAIIRMQTNDPNTPIVQHTQQMPYPSYTRDIFILMIKFLIPLMIVLAFIYTAQMIVKDIVSEKEARLIECMKMMGLPPWIHWTAWFIKIFTQFLVIIILQMIVLKYGEIFAYTMAGVTFFTLLIWCIASIFSLFLLSVFFSKGTRAMIAASVLWFGTFAPYLAIQNPDTYGALSKGAKQGLCLLPNSCLGIMVQIITQYEEMQIGVNWDNIDKPYLVDENFSLNTALGMLVFDCFLFLFFTWYIENVFPGDFGIPKPFYFCFQPSYWCGARLRTHIGSEENAQNNNFETEPTDLSVGITINGLRKTFKSAAGKKVAVDGLSLNIYKGQITALLGHNGAGKTTTLSMLTGLFPPSGGDATINGRSILTDMDAIRESLGLCPQYNVLFDRLTVREHMQFFTTLKGVPKSEAEVEINKLLTDMNLMMKADSQSSTLSGGMKRKLNCAIALVGGSETVILDEPTSGMDPYARRATWDVLQRYRGTKTMILTTHFMDEADYLGDRIAIMKDGRVHCCGSSLFLKKRFGVGYHMTIVKGPHFKENETVSTISKIVPTAKMTGNVAAELSYTLNEDTSKDFKQLFETLEDSKEKNGVSSFGVSVTTLEEVFIKVGEDGFSFDDANDRVEEATEDDIRLQARTDSVIAKIGRDSLSSGMALWMSQFKAMFMKRFLHSKRQKKAVILQLIIPLGMLLLGLVLSLAQSTQSDDPPMKMSLKMLKPKGDNIFGYVVTTSNRDAYKQAAGSYYSSEGLVLKDRSNQTWQIGMENTGSKVNVLFSKNPFLNGDISSNLDDCCKYQYLMLNKKCSQTLNSNTGKCYHSPKCALKMLRPNSSYFQEYILEDSAISVKEYFLKNVAGISVDEATESPIAWYANQGLHTHSCAYSAASNIVLRAKLNASYEIMTYNHPLPRNTREKSELATQNWGNLTLIIMHQIGMCLLAASFIVFLVTERMNKAKHVQFVSGVNSLCYWGATFCWDYINYLFPCFGYLILFAIFDLDDYRGELGAVLLVSLLYGWAVLPGVYLLSRLFTNPLNAYGNSSMLTQILSLAMYMGVVICQIPAIDELEAADVMHKVFLLVPTYAYPKALGDIAVNVAQRKTCKESVITQIFCELQEKQLNRKIYVENTFDMDNPGIGMHCLYMFLVGIVEFGFVLLIEEGFFLGALNLGLNNKVFAVGEEEDVDVAEEKNKVMSMQQSEMEDTALVVENLTKVYGGGMLAVDHINVKIPKGESLFYLGLKRVKIG